MSESVPIDPDLALVSTDALIAALKDRSEHILIARVPKANPAGKAIIETHGGEHACLGLATAAAHEILHDDSGADDV